MGSLFRKSVLAYTFSAASLTGCATLNTTDVNGGSCMDRNGYEFLGIISSRDDKYNTDCATAYAARAIAQMRRADGGVDYKAYMLALNIYEHSSLDVRKYMDESLKAQNTDIAAMKKAVAEYKASEATMCENAAVQVKQADGKTVTVTSYKCTLAK